MNKLILYVIMTRPDRTCDLRRAAEFNLSVSPRAIARICRGPRDLQKSHQSEAEFCWSSGSTAPDIVEAAAPCLVLLFRTPKCPLSRRSLALFDEVHHRDNCICLDPSKVLVCVPVCKGQLETIQDTPYKTRVAFKARSPRVCIITAEGVSACGLEQQTAPPHNCQLLPFVYF
ncbi:hypothetical protein L596_026876 [Steinernema carpocapsae]|uniref:Uncharacterized protein n=1 Tax=Steinernema carpocapsae TaxID=34508 RepID=A0A4V5ZYB3_STECR|nr:hypothetical protein L596_026876 [Steinernema carpocapsae]